MQTSTTDRYELFLFVLTEIFRSETPKAKNDSSGVLEGEALPRGRHIVSDMRWGVHIGRFQVVLCSLLLRDLNSLCGTMT